MRTQLNFCLLLIVTLLAFSCKKTEVIVPEEIHIENPNQEDDLANKVPFFIPNAPDDDPLDAICEEDPLAFFISDENGIMALESVCDQVEDISWSISIPINFGNSTFAFVIASGDGPIISFPFSTSYEYTVHISGVPPVDPWSIEAFDPPTMDAEACFSVGTGYLDYSYCDGTDIESASSDSGGPDGASAAGIIVPVKI